MKRFFQKSYSWLATLLLTVAFAMSGNVAAQGIELPFSGFVSTASGSVDGVGFYMWSANWVDSAELYGEGDASATWGTINLTSPAKNVVKVELTCRTNSWSSVSSAEAAAATICETENLGGSITTDGAVAIWQGSAHKLTFSSTDDIDVCKMVVYLEEGDVVKECTVGVDHYADNCKPGKYEGSLTRYITLYMEENTAMNTWTGQANCPAEVTLTNEDGQQFTIEQFNTWINSNQLGIVFAEEITTPGVYTLHIPEGLVAFESGKFNKEINVTWTVVEPDLRPTKDVAFDYTVADYATNVDGVAFETTGGFLAQAQALRIKNSETLTFTAPEKATIKRIQLIQEKEDEIGTNPSYFTANAGELSDYGKTLVWNGDDASVTLTNVESGTCYFTKAFVTLAVEAIPFKGVVTPNLTSVSSLADLEGIELTFVDADQVSVLEEGGDGIYVQNENGSEYYAIWHPGFGGTYEINGNVVTLRNFFSDNTDGYFNELPAGNAVLYFEDYGTFDVNNADADWDGYINTFSVAYEGAPVAQPFELAFRNNMVVCENGQKVEANEAGVGADFYLVNEGLTAVGKTATLYKDGNAMSFIMTLVDGTAISFLGGSSLITEPGTYLLEVPEGTYVDAAGNPSIAYYGQWVIIQKDEPAYTEPVLKAEDVSAEVAYYIYTDARGGLTVESADATQLVGTSEAGIDQTIDPTDVRQQFAFVNWEGNLYLYSIATEKFIGKDNRGNFTDEPVDPIYFKNEGDGTVMLYFDDSFNINLGGSKQVTIDGWKQKDAGNSFKIMVAAPFDQTDLLNKLAGPEGWNGNVLYPETAADLDALLSYTIEFEDAMEVEASGYDVLAAIFDANGDPYAIALANGVFDTFGSISFEGSKATVNFMKISDLTAAAQSSAKVAAARIGGFIQPEGHASVVFAGKSFKVDGELVYDVLQKNYDLGENGVPTGIDTIVTNGNDSIYDLNGRRVNEVRSGLYIKNGVKVFMK